MASRTYEFHPDGTVQTSSFGAVSTAEVSAQSKSPLKSGTYRVMGNVIEITVDGQTQRLVAFPFAMGAGEPPMRPGRISINGALYKP